MITTVILAAGASRRMRGIDKLLEPVWGVPLLRHVVRTALEAETGPVIVALPVAPHPRYDAIADLDASACFVQDATEGMGASLRTVMSALPDGTTHAMILLADQPDLKADDLRLMARLPSAHPNAVIWRACADDGTPGHPIVVDQSLFAGFRELAGDEGGRSIIKAAQPRVHHENLKGRRACTDLDTPEQWAIWRAETGG